MKIKNILLITTAIAGTSISTQTMLRRTGLRIPTYTPNALCTQMQALTISRANIKEQINTAYAQYLREETKKKTTAWVNYYSTAHYFQDPSDKVKIFNKIFTATRALLQEEENSFIEKLAQNLKVPLKETQEIFNQLKPQANGNFLANYLLNVIDYQGVDAAKQELVKFNHLQQDFIKDAQTRHFSEAARSFLLKEAHSIKENLEMLHMHHLGLFLLLSYPITPSEKQKSAQLTNQFLEKFPTNEDVINAMYAPRSDKQDKITMLEKIFGKKSPKNKQ